MPFAVHNVVVDTNIIISTLKRPGSLPDVFVRSVVLQQKVRLLLSEPIYQEYLSVVARPKFKRYAGFIEAGTKLIDQLALIALWLEPGQQLTVIKSDASDNKVLELAATLQPSFLVTGNSNDFTFSSFEQVQVVTVREMLALTNSR